jgi:hypothetical protein
MSYIRCTSNPENLYVWGDIDGHVYWSVVSRESNNILIRIPQEIFDGLMNKVAQRGGYVGIRQNEDDIEYRGAKLYEFMSGELDPDNCKIVLEYAGQEHRMWLVTFEHVFNNWARSSLRYNLRETWWCIRRMIPWWVNPKYWFAK